MRVLLLLGALFTSRCARAGEWAQLASLPDQEGFAGAFAGTSNGALLLAGGANFPGKKPWEGGRKVWYDHVFVLEKPDGKWKVAGKLPRPLGYGVCVSHSSGLICVGGSDAHRHYADVFRLEWKDGKLLTTSLPALPTPLANSCGALVGDVLYVAGGQDQPGARITVKSAFRINLSDREPRWKALEPNPGSGRMLAVAAGCEGSFWVVGGVDLVPGKAANGERKYLVDAYRYTPGQGWQRLADLPRPIVAAPSPAPNDRNGFTILGGDDGTQVKTAPAQHRGFRKTMLRYDLKTAKWKDAGSLPAPRVTVPCVWWNTSWVVLSGEMRPGVRSPEVWAWTPAKQE